MSPAVGSVIRATAVVKRFGSSTALDGLDLEVDPGQVFGFVGPNGAGKTTTIRLLLDLLRPTAGEVRVFGLDPRRAGREVRSRTGYLPGALDLPPRLTGRQLLADHAAIRGRRVRLDDLATRLGADLDRPIGTLSLGNRRKIGAVAAFAHEPELLVLDEPTGGLDPLVQQEFRALVREAADAGRTVFLSSHVLDEVQHVADTVAVVRAGRIVLHDRVDALLRRLLRTVRIVPGATDVDPMAVMSIPGVQGVVRGADDAWEVRLAGPAGPLLAALAPWAPADIDIARDDLEDLFLGVYRGDSPRGAAP